MPSWHPAEFFFPNAGKIAAQCPKVIKKFFKKFIFPQNVVGHVACSYDKPVKEIDLIFENDRKKTYFFPKKWLFPKKLLWTRGMNFDNPAGNSSRKDQIFLLHVQE